MRDSTLKKPRPLNNSDIQEVFSVGGLISGHMKLTCGFEMQPQQIQMVTAVYNAMVNGRHLVVEAGKGAG